MHPVYSYGLLRAGSTSRPAGDNLWEQPLTVPSMTARALMCIDDTGPAGIELVDPAEYDKGELGRSEKLIAYRLKADKAKRLRIVPLQGNRRSAFRQAAVDLTRLSKRALWAFEGDPGLLSNQDYLNMLVTLCWLKDRDLFIRHELFDGAERHRERNEGLPLVSIPVTLFLSISERRQIDHVDPDLLLPVVKIPALDFEQRLAVWRSEFEAEADKLNPVLREVARRFRYEKETIRQSAPN